MYFYIHFKVTCIFVDTQSYLHVLNTFSLFLDLRIMLLSIFSIFNPFAIRNFDIGSYQALKYASDHIKIFLASTHGLAYQNIQNIEVS